MRSSKEMRLSVRTHRHRISRISSSLAGPRTRFFVGGHLLRFLRYASDIRLPVIKRYLILYRAGIIWPLKFVLVLIGRQQAIAQLSRLDHHTLKDLGYPTFYKINERITDNGQRNSE